MSTTATQKIHDQLDHTLEGTGFSRLGPLYRGKVRDVYRTPDTLVIITTDRVSAFDHVLGTIPFKGEILNRITVESFEATRDIADNHILSVPDPNVIVARALTAFPVEFVVRAYITGSLWRDYTAGKAGRYGIDFPAGLKKDQRFDQPILTPSTKAEIGLHDEPISKADIVTKRLMSEAELEEAERIALALFRRGAERAAARGLVLVDTKYELGKDARGKIYVIDEIHTPDSSRYWVAATYDQRFAAGEAQEMLDKENLRQWLIEEHGFSGQGTPPPLDREIRVQLAEQYMELHRRLLGREFEPKVGPVGARIEENLRRAGLLKGPSGSAGDL